MTTFLTNYGWLALGLIFISLWLWGLLKPKFKKWAQNREDQIMAAAYHKGESNIKFLLSFAFLVLLYDLIGCSEVNFPLLVNKFYLMCKTLFLPIFGYWE